MRHWLRGRSLPVRALVYTALATLAFVLAAGLGAVGALALRVDVQGLLEGKRTRPADEQDAASAGVASGTANPKTAEGTVSQTARGDAGTDSGENADEEASFVHRATDANSRGDYTYLDRPSINGDPDAVVLAEPSRDRGGDGEAGYGHNTGVWYEPREEKWAIFNQDLAPVPAGTAFEVVVPPPDEGFVHRTGPDDTFGNVTYLDDPLLNGRPNAEVSVTQNWNPGGGEGVYNDHPVGVLYDRDVGIWFIYNEDGARMPEGAAFNVAVSASEDNAR
jgi:hypothetical protein